MTSKERVRAVMKRQKPDKTPAALQMIDVVKEKLLKHYGFNDEEQIYEKFDIDIRYAFADYTGRKLSIEQDEQGRRVSETFWGFKTTLHETAQDKYESVTFYPLENVETMEDLQKYTFPNPDDFDYTAITKFCEKHADKAILIGTSGSFQLATKLMPMDKLFILMLDEPEVAKAIFDGMVNFELEHYRRCFEAGGGNVDILRVHDDYGTQISMLFNIDMWREFFKENTKKFAALAHEYNAFFMQHSCGAVAPIIPELIECKVDALEPIQKVAGLEIDVLAQQYGDKISFHGGIDTQWLLPTGTKEEVLKETQYIIDTLGKNNGYILMASQTFENDVPIENIEAVYSAKR